MLTKPCLNHLSIVLQVYEEGILIQVRPIFESAFGLERVVVKKQQHLRPVELPASLLSYWVVGRAFTPSAGFDANVREFYICFQEGTAQNVVEAAFKLHFGTTL